MANIRFIGLGDMGQVIIPRLIESGHKIVGWNRTPEKSEKLESNGMGLARTPAEAGEEDVVLVWGWIGKGSLEEAGYEVYPD